MSKHRAPSKGIKSSKLILAPGTPSNAEQSWISQILLWLALFHWICITSSDAFSLVPNLDLIPISPTYMKLQAVKNPTSKRSKQLTNLVDWSSKNNIKIGGIGVGISPGDGSAGLGIVAKEDLPSNSLVLTVPSDVALSIESPGDGPDDQSVLSIVDRKSLEQLPWFAQFAVYLFKLDQITSKKNGKIDMRAWLDSLPRQFDTPIHWSPSQRNDLQYDFLNDNISRQEKQWEGWYSHIKTSPGLKDMSWDDFVWGCECARSRAFSGAYTGSAFNPFSYAFTLLLVLIYVSAGFGTLEQAANGAALVFCAQVLKDFVLPKLFKKKRYVICPIMDMANHESLGTTGEVSFEFFGDAYSLAVKSGASISKGSELCISYGTRSNDQFLQYYGFVETGNPNDVYIMPPLRDWDIAALEEACGRKVSPGRLQKLDRAGLLGRDSSSPVANADDEAENVRGGVVVTRANGVDPAIMQALRALLSTDAEWDAAGEAIGNFVEVNSGGPENERLARLAAKTALSLELSQKPTSLQEDEGLLKRMEQVKSMDSSIEEKLAVQFRTEKKKLLTEMIQKLS